MMLQIMKKKVVKTLLNINVDDETQDGLIKKIIWKV